MNDEADKLENEGLASKKVKTLTFEQIAEFFARVQASERCPICSNTNWYMGTAEEFRHIIPTIQNGSFGQAGVMVYVMVCSRCGFIRQHYSGIVEEEPDFKERDQDKLEKS